MGRPRTCECGQCRTCRYRDYWNENARRRREADPEKWSEIARRSRQKNQGNKTIANRLYRKKNPEKNHAHMSVNEAVRKGRLLVQPCEVCGDQRVHAHHDDYDKPLDVRWLCPRHHVEHHRGGQRAGVPERAHDLRS